MNKKMKIGLGILVLVVTFGTGFFVGRVTRCGGRPCPEFGMPPCHRRHHKGHPRPCPPRELGFDSEDEADRPPMRHKGGEMHIRSHEMHRAPRR